MGLPRHHFVLDRRGSEGLSGADWSASVVLSRCLGWTISKLTRDIIREHTAWERREAALAASRANFERPRGGHAFWRYFASRSRVYLNEAEGKPPPGRDAIWVIPGRTHLVILLTNRTQINLPTMIGLPGFRLGGLFRL